MVDLPHPPIGEKVEEFVDWLGDRGEIVFDTVTEQLSSLYDGLVDLLTWPDPLIFAVVVGLVAWRVRTAAFGVFVVVGLALVHALELWEPSMETLSLVLISASIAVLIGVPLGILASRNRIVRTVTMPALDVMQTMPAFVYLIPVVSFFRLGAVPGIMATVVFAMPPAVRLTELGIRQVDEEVVEAGHAFGVSPMRILASVQLPLAKPTIMAGVNQVIMLALSMVVIAGMIAAGGLGSIVYTGVTRLQIGAAFEAGLAVVILAIILDRFTAAFASPVRGRRDRRSAGDGVDGVVAGPGSGEHDNGSDGSDDAVAHGRRVEIASPVDVA